MAAAGWQGPSEWKEWNDWLIAGLHGRNSWRLPVLFTGVLFAFGRRTVTTWLRAAGVARDYEDYYYFLASLGRNTEVVVWRLVALMLRTIPLPERLLLVIDDTPTKRYGPLVEGAALHHNPTPGPADQKYLYGHVWVSIGLALRHPLWGAMALPLQAMLYVRQCTLPSIPSGRRWKFHTKLELAARQLEAIGSLLKAQGKAVWVVADGAYAKRPFLRAATRMGIVVVSRLRKDAHLRTLPRRRSPRGRTPIYGRDRIDLAKRAGQRRGWQEITCTLYGKVETKRYKTFLATYAPVGGIVRVVLVREELGWLALFCTDPNATVQEILEAFADRATIEQCFHDQKEVWGTGKQQVRNIWCNVAVFNVNLWIHTLVELWAWSLPHDQLCDRSASPWDDPQRRPSHADRRKALRQRIIDNELSRVMVDTPLPRQMLRLAKRLAGFAAAA